MQVSKKAVYPADLRDGENYVKNLSSDLPLQQYGGKIDWT